MYFRLGPFLIIIARTNGLFACALFLSGAYRPCTAPSIAYLLHVLPEPRDKPGARLQSRFHKRSRTSEPTTFFFRGDQYRNGHEAGDRKLAGILSPWTGYSSLGDTGRLFIYTRGTNPSD